MDHQDEQIAQLLVEASPAAPTDPDRLVAAGITRGRALRRRQRAGTAVAAVAVLGVIGVGAAVVPSFGDGSRPGSTPVASEPTPSVTTSPSPSASTSPTSSPTSAPTPPGDVRIAVTAAEVPATVADLLGRDGAGPLRTAAPYGAVSQPGELIAHFSWEGTLATVVIEESGDNPRKQCDQAGPGSTCTTNAAGDLQLAWGPTTGDGVTAQGVSVWQQGFEVSVLSYNAPEGKNVAPTMAAPPLSLHDLARVAGSAAWFE